MADYQYYIVESTFVARVGAGTTERLTEDGIWVDYNDRWKVLTEGRKLEDEKRALEKARRLCERDGERK